MNRTSRVNALVLIVEDIKLTANWFCSKLGFQKHPAEEDTVVSGNLSLYLEAETLLTDRTPNGLVHVALNAYDIEQALEDCIAAGLSVDSDQGDPYFNPQIWGTGTRYFNIATPFGVTVEICQRLDRKIGSPDRNIEGLGHVGILTNSTEASLAYYVENGFEQLCPLVINRNRELVADIYCVMVGRGDMVLELFSVENSQTEIHRQWSRIDRMVVDGPNTGVLMAPSLERLEIV